MKLVLHALIRRTVDILVIWAALWNYQHGQLWWSAACVMIALRPWPASLKDLA